MKFYDRDKELESLRRVQAQAFREHSRMIVLTGRRRIGKTSLGRMMMEGSPSVYLFVGRKNEAILCSEFAAAIRDGLGEYVPEGVRTFREIFKMLMLIGERRQFNLFIDEFQEFLQINPSAYSDMQNLWDTHRRTSRINLVLSGSVYSMMERIFKDEKEPLFGRADMQMRLGSFGTEVMRGIMADYKPDYTNDDLLALYAITGGVPKYMELLLDNGCTDICSMADYVTHPDSPFIDEGRNLLIQEFGKQYGTYFSILSVIAGGEVTQTDIEKSLGEKSLGGQLRLLEEKFDIIQKRRPIMSKEGSQTVRFEIKDNFLRFWFRYFDRHRSLIEIGNSRALARIIRDDYNVYSGFALERWFRQKLMETMDYSRIGGWWLPKSKEPMEIDIVGVTLDGQVRAYEVKRQRRRYSEQQMETKVNTMRSKLFKGQEVTYGCLSIEDM